MTIIRQTHGTQAAHGAHAHDVPVPPREVWLSLKRGWRQTCPSCARAPLYKSYLKVNDSCAYCGEEMHHQRADDAPPYFTMLVTGHVIVGGILAMEQAMAPPTWVHLAIWLPALVVLSLWLLPRIKGALIGYQWANRMHGFGGSEIEGVDIAPADPRVAN